MTDAGVRAAKRQAARKGVANPVGFARWDFDGRDIRLRGRPDAVVQREQDEARERAKHKAQREWVQSKGRSDR